MYNYFKLICFSPDLNPEVCSINNLGLKREDSFLHVVVPKLMLDMLSMNIKKFKAFSDIIVVAEST